MTEACRNKLLNTTVPMVIVFERKDDSNTMVWGNGWSEVFPGAFWNLKEFLKIW